MLAYGFYFAKVFIFLVFTYSAFSKIRDPKAFMDAVRGFDVLPTEFVKPGSTLFIMFELLIAGFILLGGVFLQMGLAMALFLLVIFTLALFSVLRKGLRAKCNCFGSTKRNVSVSDITRNIFFICVALATLLTSDLTTLDLNQMHILERMLMTVTAAILVFFSVNSGELFEIFSQA